MGRLYFVHTSDQNVMISLEAYEEDWNMDSAHTNLKKAKKASVECIKNKIECCKQDISMHKCTIDEMRKLTIKDFEPLMVKQ